MSTKNTYTRLPPDPVIECLILERKRRGWTQARVARQLRLRGHKCGQGVLSAWERRVNDTDLAILRDWLDLFGLGLGVTVKTD